MRTTTTSSKAFLDFMRQRMLEEVPDFIRIEGGQMIFTQRLTVHNSGIEPNRVSDVSKRGDAR
ncbi:MAG: hypothetical protein WA869_06040 [Alloacidobacterium sp.]|jgi:hypothetical protein